MIQRFKHEFKLLYMLMKLYRFAYIPDPIISLITLATTAMTSFIAVDFVNGTATATTALFAYAVMAGIVGIVSHYYSKYALFKEVEVSLACLYGALGETLVALLSGTRMQTDVVRWIRRRKVPTRQQINRLNFAYDMFCDVSQVIGLEQTRWWFVSANTGPDETSPAEAIRTGRFEDARISATKAISTTMPLEDRDL